MKFHIYQVVVSIISLVMIYQGIAQYIKGKSGQTFLKLATRLIVWGGMGAIAIFPDLSNNIATAIGIEGNINAVILIGFIFIFLMIFKLLSAIERLEQNLSIVIRNDAIKKIK